MTPTAPKPVLVLNAGSSSIKYAVFAGLERVRFGQVEGIGTRPCLTADGMAQIELSSGLRHSGALEEIVRRLRQDGFALASFAACGHRLVHGGTRYVAPEVIGDGQLEALNALRKLAPLHNTYGLDAIEALKRLAPGVPQVACFDTAFHATIPDLASRFALPDTHHEAGYRRFGFHGINYEHVVAELPRVAGTLPSKLIVFHLGNGSSLCAVSEGRSVATTMGYSTLDGLVMGTRCGAIDPGVLIALQRDRGMSLEALEQLLYRESGLLGLSGMTSDMRELLASNDPRAERAVDHYCYWAARHAGSLATALGGLDAIAFTGGIGFGGAEVRRRISAHLAWLGLELDDQRNQARGPRISTDTSRVAAWVIAADEERAIVRQVRRILSLEAE